MTLASLLNVLKDNLNLMLTIIDDGSPLITFDAAGASVIITEIGEREVERIGVSSVDLFHIYLSPNNP